MRESSTEDRWGTLSRHATGVLSLDVVAVGGFLLLADGVLLGPFDPGSVLRGLVGLPILFFVPGYALISALFPTARPRNDGSARTTAGIDGRERLALSVGTSLALLVLLAILLSLLGFRYTADVVVVSLSVLTASLMALAVLRRRQLPAYQRFRVPHEDWIDRLHRGFGTGSTTETVLNVALVLLVLVSVVGMGIVLTVPNNAETFTAETLLTENEAGELVAGDYPDTIGAEGERFVLQLTNHETETVSYTVVGELQRVDASGPTTDVLEREQVLRTSTMLVDGETWSHPHTVGPALAGEDVRLIYYVYRGEPATTPTVDSAYRYTHVWVDVPESSA